MSLSLDSLVLIRCDMPSEEGRMNVLSDGDSFICGTTCNLPYASVEIENGKKMREAESLTLDYERKRLLHLGIAKEPKWTSLAAR